MLEANLPQEIIKLAATTARRVPAGVRWAVTCGCALALNGIDHRPSDLDIFAPARDAQLLWGSPPGVARG